MERKGTAVVTTELVAEGLKRAPGTAREEQALRMRYGARVDPMAPLPQQVEAESELADELLLLEMRLLSALKRQRAMAKQAAPAPSKAKIVSNLKKKK